MNRRELLTSTIATAAAGALGLKVVPESCTVSAYGFCDVALRGNPIYPFGLPGIGKRQIVRKVAETRGLTVVDQPLAFPDRPRIPC